MNPHAARALEIETTFLAGAEANLNAAAGGLFRGSRFTWTTRSEEDRLRSLVRDRDTLRSMPKNTTRIMTGTQRKWLFRRRRTCVVMASALSPLEHYVEQQDPPPPVGLAELVDHVKRLAAEADVPHTIGVCSPSGFTDDARTCGLELPGVTLVLVEPRPDGGWATFPASPNARPEHGKLFDPEAVSKKLRRVKEEIDSRSADLLTGGLSALAIADRLGLPPGLVKVAFERKAATEHELRVTHQGDDLLLFRGAPADMEEDEMSMVDRLRQLLGGEGNETRKINALSERRVKLTQRRDRLYDDIAKLEKRESDLIAQGKQAASPSTKRRIATQIKQLRDDMNRLGATAKMLGQQVEIISTHIHNLTLIQQGKQARLPSSQEITEDAVRAEEMLEQLGADVELVGSLSTGASDATMSDEEMDILRELEGEPAGPGTESAAAPAEPPAADRPEPSDKAREPRPREPEAG